MAKSLFSLKRIWMKGNWWHGIPAAKVREDLTRAREELKAFLGAQPRPRSKTVVVTAHDDYDFIIAALASLMEKCNLVLGSASWTLPQMQDLGTVLPPNTVLNDGTWRLLPHSTVHHKQAGDRYKEPWIAIATGGSSGKFRLAVHTLKNLSVAAEAFAQLIKGGPLHNILSLPLYHVSGWMSLWRAWCTGGMIITKRQIYSIGLPNPGSWFVSIVPTQLHRELLNANPAIPFAQLRGILVGGASISEELAKMARSREWPVIPCYGMTETAAMVTALKKDDFLRGISGYGPPLAHAQLLLDKDSGPTHMDTLSVSCKSLFLGYLGEKRFNSRYFSTQDSAYLSPEGSLHIAGRTDYVINTGGEKVSPESVEWVVQQNERVLDAAVTGVPDQEWGERVVCLVEWNAQEPPNAEALLEEIRSYLQPFQLPKEILNVRKIPRNDLGKMLRGEVAQMARTREPGDQFY